MKNCGVIRDLPKAITNNSDNYVENYMKIKVNSDEDFPLNKTLKRYITR